MRILQLTPQMAGVGGIATYVRGLTSELTDSGHECVVFAGDPGSEDCAGAVEYVPDLAVGSRPSGLPETLAARVAEVRPDAVLVHVMPDGLLLDGLLARGYPVAAFVHSFACSTGKVFRRRDEVCTHAVSARCLWDWYKGPCGSTPSPLIAIRTHRTALHHLTALRRVPLVLVGSDFMKRYLIGEGLLADRITVDNWFPHSTPSPDAHRIHRELGPHRILFVGRLTYDKGVHHLLDALAELDNTFFLRIVGDGWHKAALEQQCRHLGIGDRVCFTGSKRGVSLDQEFAAADVAVVPSVLPEPWGMVVGEAASHGLPVVVSAVGGLPEWQGRGMEVTTCPPARPKELAAAIEDACFVSAHERRALRGDENAAFKQGKPAMLLNRLVWLANFAGVPNGGEGAPPP